MTHYFVWRSINHLPQHQQSNLQLCYGELTDNQRKMAARVEQPFDEFDTIFFWRGEWESIRTPSRDFGCFKGNY